MEFLLGVVSSLIASLIFVWASKVTFEWIQWLRAFPKGIRLVALDRHAYLKRIAALIRSNKKRLFFRGLTGFDLFSSDIVKMAFDETKVDSWEELVFVLTDPKSKAFSSEPDKSLTPERLTRLQQTVIDFLNDYFFAKPPTSDKTTKRGIFYIEEDKNLFNMLILDTEAYIFFRGFTARHKAATGQVIVNINLQKCPELVEALISHVKEYYLQSCTPYELSDS